jgi:hypothetical protein
MGYSIDKDSWENVSFIKEQYSISVGLIIFALTSVESVIYTHLTISAMH